MPVTIEDLERRFRELDQGLSMMAAQGIEPPRDQVSEYERLRVELAHAKQAQMATAAAVPSCTRA
jgi:hypothetical protein